MLSILKLVIMATILLQSVGDNKQSISTTVTEQAATISSVIAPAPYLLAGDDVISISVLNFPMLNTPQLIVSPDGVISLPLIDSVNVLGKTPAQLSEILTTKWKRFVINPKVAVTLVQRRQDSVLIYGEVNKPGADPYKPPMHLLELMAWGGGPLLDADLAHVAVTHKDGTKKQVDLTHPGTKGGTDQDLLLQNGDVAFLPPRNVSVEVIGEVQHPGSYPFKEDMTVLDAITAAGGVNIDTPDYAASTLTHNGVDSKLDLDAMLRHGDVSGNIKLSPGDRIMIPLAHNRIYVYGAVGRPGFYLFKPGDRILDALNGCGGNTPDSDMLRVYVVHVNKDKTVALAQKVNLLKFMKQGKMDNNLLLAPGDVIFVPTHHKSFELNDIWNILAPLNLILDSGKILSGNFN